uniref:(northern house mosquito) hypothetical protein n=1 Tax=Culex pipiens TaxID=7175 RepID=A0A8D8CA20_CULPI
MVAMTQWGTSRRVGSILTRTIRRTITMVRPVVAAVEVTPSTSSKPCSCFTSGTSSNSWRHSNSSNHPRPAWRTTTTCPRRPTTICSDRSRRSTSESDSQQSWTSCTTTA